VEAQSPGRPVPEDAYTLPPAKLAQAKALARIDLTLEILGSLWALAVLWFFLASRFASNLETWTMRLTRHRWIQGLLFFAIFLILTTLASLPFDIAGHAAALHYAISVQSWLSWFGDQGKSLAIALLGTLLLLFFNWLIRVSPRRYWLWMWAISLPLTVAMIVAAPVVIDPLFNKFEPLLKTHAPLVAKLETVVARTGTQIPPDRMFLMKASEKSNGINAYVTGLASTKRFVMWDTTTDRMPDDEILFIFGHESGHYVLNHIPQELSITMLGAFFVLWACARFAEWLIRRFGPRWGIESLSSRAGFLTLIFALSIAGFLLTPATNTLSRHYEHEADIYGQEALHGLVPDPQKTAVSAFNHLGESWLEDPAPSPFLEFWDMNHPSVQTRARFARQYNPWANGGHGQFFAK
jgi:Zn-dependent protease with chaperone function